MELVKSSTDSLKPPHSAECNHSATNAISGWFEGNQSRPYCVTVMNKSGSPTAALLGALCKDESKRFGRRLEWERNYIC
jgi:hypothetical protein